MPIYDLICSNNHIQRDLYLKVGERPPCPECGATTDTYWESSASVIPDEIPGGMWVHHGICNEDGTPRKYYSKSEMAAEAKRRGLVNLVRHAPESLESDKSRHTIKWY